MSAAHAQAHVKQFIRDEVHGILDFNKHTSTGMHANFLVRAARAAGLFTKKIGGGHYFFRDGVCIGQIEALIPSLVSHSALKIGRSKQLTKELLHSAGVAVPQGRVFLTDQMDEAAEYFQSMSVPAVVKPNGGHGGSGVTCGVVDSEHFTQAWLEATSADQRGTSVLVEEFTTGLDLRVFVVESEVVAAASRLPAFVVGDGKSTVAELVDQKQMLRNQNKYLGRMPIVVDTQWVHNSGISMDDILPEDEIVVLNSTVNLHQGGENVDVTAMLSDDLKAMAVASVEAIPGMGSGGVDFVAKSPRTAEDAVVLELNVGANISVHHLPAYGQPANVARALIDAMVERAA